MTENYQMTLLSRISDKKLLFTLPHCLYLGGGGSPLPPSGSAETYDIYLRMHKFAFSRTDFKVNDQCSPEEETEEVTIRSMTDIATDTNPFTYNLSFEIGGSTELFLGEKDHVLLYKTSPDHQAFFYKQSFPNMTYPLSVDFVGKDTKNSQYKYYFRVHTIIHGEFELNYTVVANYDTVLTHKYMDKFKRSLERGENPLEQKEAIQAFMRNNEAVARYFEEHSTVIN